MELYEHSLSGIDPEALRVAMLALAGKSATELPGHLKTLFDLLRNWNPLHTIAILAGWGLMAPVSEDGASQRSMIPKLQQHHLELLQALALTVPLTEWGRDPAPQGEIQKVIDALIEVADAFMARRFQAVSKQRDLQERTVLALQERLRSHTQAVRNWGYFSDVVRISTELYAPLDVALTKQHGFGATDLIEVCRALLQTIETWRNERFKRLKSIFRARSIRQLVRLYYERYPGVEGDPEEFIRGIPAGTGIDAVKQRLLGHADLSFAKLSIVPVEDLAEMTGRSADVVRKILDVVSLTPGALSKHDPESLFLANPVWPAPGVNFGGTYFFAFPQAVFSHIHSIMRPLCEAAGIKVAMERRRAVYLEAKVRELVEAALPGATLLPGKRKWGPNEEYETDVIAAIDRVILIFEAKSAALTPQGLRGAPERVKRHIKELIVEPSQQSARLEDFIWKAKAGDAEALEVISRLPLDVAEVDTVIRVSVTLDDFSILSSAVQDLAGAGWIPEDLELAPTLNIADFGCVVDLLHEPAFFLHYLAERGRVQRVLNVFGDELDLLGFYLETGFNLGSLEGGDYRVSISGMSHALDVYYTSRDTGVVLPKPRPKVTPYFQALLKRLQDRAPSAWTTMALDLLRSANLEEQQQIDRALERLRKGVAKTYRDPKHECCAVMIPPASREGMVLFYVYPRALADRRREVIEQLTSESMEAHGRERCVFVGRQIEEWQDTYRMIGLAYTT